uniref:Uncharacterized protein n=1 Tax=Setaria italica TaxID=4555 RepID=K4A3T1_SETIT
MKWELIEQLFTLTLDNASVNNKAVKDIHDALSEASYSPPFLEDVASNSRCFAR